MGDKSSFDIKRYLAVFILQSYLSYFLNNYGLKRYIFTFKNTSTTVYHKGAKRSIPCAPLLSLNGSKVIIAAAQLLAYN